MNICYGVTDEIAALQHLGSDFVDFGLIFQWSHQAAWIMGVVSPRSFGKGPDRCYRAVVWKQYATKTETDQAAPVHFGNGNAGISQQNPIPRWLPEVKGYVILEIYWRKCTTTITARLRGISPGLDEVCLIYRSFHERDSAVECFLGSIRTPLQTIQYNLYFA